MASVATHSSPEDVLRNLYPTVLECFGIIFIGYILGRFNIVTPSQGRGIGKYVTSVALPAVIFTSLTKVKFGLVDWGFWSSFMISKLLVFALVTSVTMLFGKSIGKAGLYGIFVTQSNDLALGVPLFSAIYRTTHPEFVEYLYLLIPVSMAILNPVGFAMLEYEKAQESNTRSGRKAVLHVLWKAFRGFITNPLVFMVIFGLLGNVVLSEHIPRVIEQFLDVLSQSFGATALFTLGLTMVGKMNKYTGFSLVVPIVLIVIKSLFLPLLMRESVYVFANKGNNATEAHSVFAFLYGTLPTAPPVVLYATAYSCEVDTIASSMVLGTVLALPIMLVSSIMMSVSSHKATMDFMQVISDMSFDVCFVGIACCIWVIAVLIFVRSITRVPQRYTFCIVLCQAMMSLSIAFSRIKFDQHVTAMLIAGLFVIGLIGCHCWVAILAYVLYVLRCKGEQRAKENCKLIMILGWSVPVITALILVPLIPSGCLHLNSKIMLFDFRMHRSFNAASIVVLTTTIVAAIVLLALLMRNDRYCRCKSKRQGTLSEPLVPEDSCNGCKSIDRQKASASSGSIEAADGAGEGMSTNGDFPCCSATRVDIEDMRATQCMMQQQQERPEYSLLNDEDDNDNMSVLLKSESVFVGEYLQGEQHQLSRHVILIVILTLVAAINLFLCLWRLLGDHRSGIYLELEFLLALCTFGQGFVSFAIFGFDAKMFSLPESFSNVFASCKRKKTVLTPVEDLSPEVTRLCDKFTMHHMHRCRADIVKNIRCRLRKYNNTFRGTELVDWLVENGLAISRPSAVKYGNRLLQGRVVEHITQEHMFYDLPYFYHFAEDPGSFNLTTSD